MVGQDIPMTLEEVLDKVRSHKVDDVVERIELDFQNIWVPASAHLDRLNYPQNCYTVNLTEINQARRKTLQNLLNILESTKVYTT